MPEVPPGPRGHPSLAAGKDRGDWRGLEGQGCPWSPGLWVRGETGLQRGSPPGDRGWWHSPGRGHHPFFKVLRDLLPGPPRAPEREHPPSQQHPGSKGSPPWHPGGACRGGRVVSQPGSPGRSAEAGRTLTGCLSRTAPRLACVPVPAPAAMASAGKPSIPAQPHAMTQPHSHAEPGGSQLHLGLHVSSPKTTLLPSSSHSDTSTLPSPPPSLGKAPKPLQPGEGGSILSTQAPWGGVPVLPGRPKS